MTARRDCQHPGGEPVNAGKSVTVAAKAAAIDAAQARPLTWKTVAKRALAVAVACAAIYLALPKLIAVLGAWPRLSTLNPVWFTVCLAAELVSFTCNFALQRLALRTKGWFPMVTAGLAGNAVTNSLPGGSAYLLFRHRYGRPAPRRAAPGEAGSTAWPGPMPREPASASPPEGRRVDWPDARRQQMQAIPRQRGSDNWLTHILMAVPGAALAAGRLLAFNGPGPAARAFPCREAARYLLRVLRLPSCPAVSRPSSPRSSRAWRSSTRRRGTTARRPVPLQNSSQGA